MRFKTLAACLPSLLALCTVHAASAQTPFDVLVPTAPPAGVAADPTRLGYAFVDPAALRAAAIELRPLRIAVDGEVDVTVTVERIEERGAISFSVFGHTAGGKEHRAVLTVERGTLDGRIRLPSRTLRLRLAGVGVYGLYEAGELTGGCDTGEVAWEAIDPVPLPGSTSRAGGVVVDLMLVYTPTVEDEHGSGLAAFLRAAVDEFNDALDFGDHGYDVRLVHTQRVDYDESSSMQTDEDRLVDPDDGEMDEVHAARDEHGADLVSLVVDSADDICGTAAGIMMYPGANPALAFNVVQEHCMDAGDLSLAHEFGHNLGLRHATDNDVVPFPFGHGYADADNGFRDIMATSAGCDSCVRRPFFSDADGTYQGHPTGDSGWSDADRALDISMEYAALFRPETMGDPMANLQITAAVADTPTVPAGEEGSVTYTTANIGTASVQATDDWDVRYYISTDQTRDAGDVAVGRKVRSRIAIFEPGWSDEETDEFDVPAVTTPGPYFLLVVADSDGEMPVGEVPESNENDNVRFVSLTVGPVTAGEDTPIRGDLALSRLSPNPAPGPVSFTVTGGDGHVPMQVAVVDVMGRRVATLHDGPYTAPRVLQTPNGLAPGHYLIVATSRAHRATLAFSVIR